MGSDEQHNDSNGKFDEFLKAVTDLKKKVYDAMPYRIRRLFFPDKKNTTYLIMGILLLVSLLLCGVVVDTKESFKGMVMGTDYQKGGVFTWLLYGILNPGVSLLVWCCFIGVALLLYVLTNKNDDGNYLDYANNVELSDSDVHGSSRWMSNQEIAEKFYVGPIEGTNSNILGFMRDQSGAVIAIDESKSSILTNRHKAVFAKSGEGKTWGVIIPDIAQSIKRGESCFVTDPKGDVYKTIAPIARAWGYKVRVFNLFNLSHSDGCNLLEHIWKYDEPGVPNLESGALTMARTIVMNTTKKGDQYAEISQNLIQAAILYYTYDRDPERIECTLPMIYDFFARDREEIQADIERLADGHPSKGTFESFFGGSPNYVGNAIQSVTQRLAPINSRLCRQVLSHSDIDLSTPGDEKCIYFVITNDQDSSMWFLASMFYTAAFQVLSANAKNNPNKSGALNVPVNFDLDEMANTAKVPDFAAKISVVRSQNIAVTIILQSLGQMKKEYPEDWSTILTNCDTQEFLGGMDVEETLLYWEKLLGPATVVKKTTSQPQSKIMANASALHTTYNESQSDASRPLRNASELRTLSNDEKIIVIGKQNPIRCLRFKFHLHPFYKKYGEELQTEHVPLYLSEDAYENAMTTGNRNVSVGHGNSAPVYSGIGNMSSGQTVAYETKREYTQRKNAERQEMDEAQMMFERGKQKATGDPRKAMSSKLTTNRKPSGNKRSNSKIPAGYGFQRPIPEAEENDPPLSANEAVNRANDF